MSFSSDDIKGLDYTLNYGNSKTSDTYRLRLTPSDSLKLQNHDIAVKQFQIYKSIPNISSTKGNSSFTFVDWNGGSHTIDLFQGLNTTSALLEVSNINGILQAQMKLLGYYLLDSSNSEVYYLSMSASDLYNKVLITSTQVPTALPSGYSIPSGGVALPGSASYMQITIPSTALRTNLGFDAGTYPNSQTTPTNGVIVNNIYYQLSTVIPQIRTTTAITLRCNLSAGSQSPPFIPNYLATIPISGASLETETFAPPNLTWIHVAQQTYSYIEIVICDQDGNPLTDLTENFATSIGVSIVRRDSTRY